MARKSSPIKIILTKTYDSVNVVNVVSSLVRLFFFICLIYK